MRLKFTLQKILAIVLAMLILAGCQPAAATELPMRQPPTQAAATAGPAEATAVVATAALDTQPAAGGNGAYPAAQPETAAPTETQASPSSGYPAGGYPAPGDSGPGSVPVVPNRGTVTGKILDMQPDPNNADYSRVHVLVLTSADVEGSQNRTKELVNQEADFYIETFRMPLRTGDSFEALVAYDGDESGGRFYILEIKKTS